MDFYNTLASLTGWPAVVALLLLGGAYGYWALSNRIAFLKEKNDWLEKEVANLKEYTPDVLAQRLSSRLKLLSEELEKLHADQETSQETIKSRELEINQVKSEIGALSEQLETAQKLLSDSDLVCPYCGAPLETREYESETVWYEERDIDVDHEHVTYECGLEFADGRVLGKCSKTNLPEDNPSP